MATPTKTNTPAIARCRKAANALGWRHPHFFVLHARMAYREDSRVSTMGVTADGLIYVNPTFVAKLSQEELSGVIAHEIMHPVLRHFERAIGLGIVDSQGKLIPGKEDDAKILNDAQDWCINHALKADGIRLPACALEIDPAYLATGAPIQSEPIFHWMKAQLRQGNAPSGMSPEGEGEKSPGGGCGVLPPEKGEQGKGEAPGGKPEGDQPYGVGPGESWASVAAQARAHALLAGRGSSALAHLMTPYEPTIDWARVIRRGFNLAQVRPGNEFASYSRVPRRASLSGLIRPGWFGGAPSVAFVVDVSGSMAREWVSQIVGEIVSAMATFQTKAFLVTHTDQVCWAGWVKPGDKEAIIEACGHSGGTDPTSAYARVGEEKTPFQALVHFTDCELSAWPENPARKLIVGAFGRGAETPYCTPPEGAEVIPCHTPCD